MALFHSNSYSNKRPAEIQHRSSGVKNAWDIQEEELFANSGVCPRGAEFPESLLQEQGSWQAPSSSRFPSINTCSLREPMRCRHSLTNLLRPSPTSCALADLPFPVGFALSQLYRSPPPEDWSKPCQHCVSQPMCFVGSWSRWWRWQWQWGLAEAWHTPCWNHMSHACTFCGSAQATLVLEVAVAVLIS